MKRKHKTHENLYVKGGKRSLFSLHFWLPKLSMPEVRNSYTLKENYFASREFSFYLNFFLFVTLYTNQMELTQLSVVFKIDGFS